MHARPDVTLTMCRDCCCGSPTKHPDVDHAGHRERLLALHGVVPTSGRSVRVQTVTCLDRCADSNVLLVREHEGPGRWRDTWLGEVLDDDQVAAVETWVREGGPVPAVLEARRLGPAR